MQTGNPQNIGSSFINGSTPGLQNTSTKDYLDNSAPGLSVVPNCTTSCVTEAQVMTPNTSVSHRPVWPVGLAGLVIVVLVAGLIRNIWTFKPSTKK